LERLIGIPSRKSRVHLPLILLGWTIFLSSPLWAQGNTSSQPARWQAQYTQIYSDNIETIAPSLGPAFSLGSAGSLTSNPSAVISGKQSIEGSYSGSASYTPYLQTNPSVLAFTPNHSYTVTFQYKVLAAPGSYFEVLFYSATGSAQYFLRSFTITASSPSTGTATLTGTLGNYSDYQVLWTIASTGAISIDNIQITDGGTGKVIASENAEGTSPGPGSGLVLRNGASVVTDPAQVISGQGSIMLSNLASVETNPAIVTLGPNTTYIVEFQYRILKPGTGTSVMGFSFQEPTTRNPALSVNFGSLLKNAATSGTSSAGAQTAGSVSYALTIAANAGATVVIDNIAVYRQDPVQTSSPLPAWNASASLPYPRLGKYGVLSSSELAQSAPAEGVPFLYTVAQIENRLSLFDFFMGTHPKTQSMEPDEIRRLRILNPGMIILPGLISEEVGLGEVAPAHSTVDIDHTFLQGVNDGWYAHTSTGSYVKDPLFPIREMNISDYAPVVNGQTFGSYWTGFLTGTVFPSGIWEGTFMDNLFGHVNPHIPNYNNPALFDVDYNRNGLRDETPAFASDITRKYATQTLGNLRTQIGDSQILVGNGGNLPNRSLATFVNGYLFECFNENWDAPKSPSEGGWRHFLDSYRVLQSTLHRPVINVLQGCGRDSAVPNPNRQYAAATPNDIQRHRTGFASALLGDAFYGYDLFDLTSAPYWFDEYAVDASGTAVESRAGKGYLGLALTDAEELADASTNVLKEDFESGGIPAYMFADPGTVSITRQPGEVISGAASLVLNNPDHTKQAFVKAWTNPAQVPLPPGTYVVSMDYRVLETLDSRFFVAISDGTHGIGIYQADGVVAGDSETIRFPVTISSAGNWSVYLNLAEGGGKIAIDNLKIDRGGAGPWRRDFENGFVLVNPLLNPHTFSVAELAGTLNRTGIHRIKGTQAPDVNNGQPVTDSLTLAPFDAIVLLADRIPVATPSITSVDMAGGSPGIAQNGWIEIKGVNLAPPGIPPNGMTWDNAPNFTLGLMPAKLGGASVTVDGKPAFVYYVSPTQVNVLTPLDNMTGPVQVVVNSSGVSSSPFTVNMQSAAPSIPLIGTTQYVVAQHADYSLVGPASLSSPGYPFTSAHKGETIVLYAFGLGLPATPLVNGASIQSGPLPALPQVQIGGATAMVTFAGVISPGLYQLNVIIPQGAHSGDNSLVLTYNGQTSPAGDLISVQ
jgi:uncharacterized protein (TIGR03437 family)